jgi:hypothetical protein
MTPSLFRAVLALKSNEQAWADSDAYSDYFSIAQIAIHASGTSLVTENAWDILCKVTFRTHRYMKTTDSYASRYLTTRQPCSLRMLEQTECI